ncbi:MAG: rhodanese-like domain-containing protein [Chthoniobacterales bacterium]
MSRIHSELSMADLLQVYPGAQRALFRQYHIGGCSSCGFRTDETIADICERNENIPVDEMITYLEQSEKDDEKMMITPRELAKALKAGTARLLDIRTQEEFEAVHLPQAIHFTQELTQQIMGSWPKDEFIAILDHEGRRSLDAAAYFAGHGFTQIKAVKGGIDAWSVEVDPEVPRYELEVHDDA